MKQIPKTGVRLAECGPEKSEGVVRGRNALAQLEKEGRQRCTRKRWSGIGRRALPD